MTEPPDDYLRQVVIEAKRIWRGKYVELKVVKTTKGVHLLRTDKLKFEYETKKQDRDRDFERHERERGHV